MNINFIADYTAEYHFGPENTENIAAYQLELQNSNEQEKIRDFLQQSGLDFAHLYLLTYQEHNLSYNYNKITEKRKIWGRYPDMEITLNSYPNIKSAEFCLKRPLLKKHKNGLFTGRL